MLAIERKNEILDKLRAEQRVLVSDLAEYYNVTEETIRRDLDKLEKEGYATKTYGGAILGNSTKTDLSYTIRNKTNVEAKNQIAAIASRLIEDGDHLMLDDSSTSLYLAKKLKEKDVEIRGDERAQKACSLVVPATDEDFATEYLDYIISVKTVDTVDEAIAHINANSTGHSEAIITENKENAEKFLKCIDSSSVYVNASTRFTDGAEFGLGAEIGISTQKLHARGPMGLEQLTSTKYLIYGDGQVR